MTRFCVLAATALAFATPALAAEAPVITDKAGRSRAHPEPEQDWCGPVVSFVIETRKGALEESPEDTQKFIGGARAVITQVCPAAEIVRIRATVDGVGVLQAYTTKTSNWRILAVAAGDDVLPMLDMRKLLPETYLGVAARLETQVHFARAKLAGLKFDEASKPSPDHVDWTLADVEGATYAFFNWSKQFPELADLADAIASALNQNCTGGRDAHIRGEVDATLSDAMVTRRFRCVTGDKHVDIGVVAKKVDNVATAFIVRTEKDDVFDQTMSSIADKSLVY